MKHYKVITQEELSDLTCDKCLKKVNKDSEPYQFQEFISISHRCGYESIFEDGVQLTLDLCQHCFKNECGEFIQVNAEPNRITKSTAVESKDEGFKFEQNAKLGLNANQALLLQSLIKAMAEHPSLRFMQLLMNTINPSDTAQAYYCEDESVISLLDQFNKK
ncbi:MAG: hypothetical protein OCD00_03690 [Colwellia sp.]